MIIKAKGKQSEVLWIRRDVLWICEVMIGLVYEHNVLELFTLLLSWVS
jgi:hypothetical protein